MKARFAPLIVLLALMIPAAPIVGEAQQTAKVPRIGVLTLISSSSAPQLFGAFRQGLHELGYVEGQNIALEYREPRGSVDRFSALAAEPVRMKVDLIVTESAQAALAAKRATQTIPVVMAVVSDPVELGLAASLARPGGNLTGLSLQFREQYGRRLQLLKEAAPKAILVAVLWNPTNPAAGRAWPETEAAARSLGLRLHSVEARSPADLDGAFELVASARPSALLTIGDGMAMDNRMRIVDFAARSQLPAIFPDREFAEAGGLMTYGPNLPSNFRRAATYVDKILKGAKPAELPIEQPTKFDLAINLKTARALGLTIPALAAGPG